MVQLGSPFTRIVGVSWGAEPPSPMFFFLRSGYDPASGIRGAGGEDSTIPGTDPPQPGEVNLVYVNPSDPAWEAVCGVLVTINGEGSPEMQLAWTGRFLDTREDDPNDMPWLDGLELTIEGYGPLPALGAVDPFSGLFRQTYDGFRTIYVWVNFPDTGAIPPFPVSEAFVTEDEGPERFQITYPGWEDYFNTTTTGG